VRGKPLQSLRILLKGVYVFENNAFSGKALPQEKMI
jgi:hypothetical protein